jgi:hypothetical protein
MPETEKQRDWRLKWEAQMNGPEEKEAGKCRSPEGVAVPKTEAAKKAIKSSKPDAKENRRKRKSARG